MNNYIICSNNYEHLSDKDKELFEENRIKLKELVEIKRKRQLNEDEDQQILGALMFFKYLKQNYRFGGN